MKNCFFLLKVHTLSNQTIFLRFAISFIYNGARQRMKLRAISIGWCEREAMRCAAQSRRCFAMVAPIHLLVFSSSRAET
jgi:hypothetical protein